MFGAPEPPAGLPSLDSIGSGVYHWGDTTGSWGPTSYTDGSGFDSSLPDIRRCGQAVVQLDPYSWMPIRALYGPLPYLVQTVGRAERYAIKMGLAAHPDHFEFVTDLEGLVKEGAEWGPHLASSRSKHARVWRDILTAARERSLEDAPTFRWTPAHRSATELMEAEPREICDWIGNAWADYFARLGAIQHTVARTLSKSIVAAMKQHRLVLQFLSQACLRVICYQRYGRDAVPAKPLRQQMGPVVFGRPDDHDLWHCEQTGQYRCRTCNATASTQASLASLRSGSLRRCAPTAVTRAMAKVFFDQTCHTWTPAVDIRAEVALRCADIQREAHAAGSPQQPDNEAIGNQLADAVAAAAIDDPPPPAGAADDPMQQAFRELGHDTFLAFGVYCCSKCAGVCVQSRPQHARKLRKLCEGFSRNPTTKHAQTTAIERVRLGLPPRQRGGDRDGSGRADVPGD